MRERMIRADDGIELATEAFGDPAHPPVLLIWARCRPGSGDPRRSAEAWRTRSRHVIRYDHRDTGVDYAGTGRADLCVRRSGRTMPIRVLDGYWHPGCPCRRHVDGWDDRPADRLATPRAGRVPDADQLLAGRRGGVGSARQQPRLSRACGTVRRGGLDRSRPGGRISWSRMHASSRVRHTLSMRPVRGGWSSATSIVRATSASVTNHTMWRAARRARAGCK